MCVCICGRNARGLEGADAFLEVVALEVKSSLKVRSKALLVSGVAELLGGALVGITLQLCGTLSGVTLLLCGKALLLCGTLGGLALLFGLELLDFLQNQRSGIGHGRCGHGNLRVWCRQSELRGPWSRGDKTCAGKGAGAATCAGEGAGAATGTGGAATMSSSACAERERERNEGGLCLAFAATT